MEVNQIISRDAKRLQEFMQMNRALMNLTKLSYSEITSGSEEVLEKWGKKQPEQVNRFFEHRVSKQNFSMDKIMDEFRQKFRNKIHNHQVFQECMQTIQTAMEKIFYA